MKQRVVTRRARKEKKLKEQRQQEQEQEEQQQRAAVAVVQGLTSDMAKSTTQTDDAQDKALHAPSLSNNVKPLFDSSSIGVSPSNTPADHRVKPSSSDLNAFKKLSAAPPESSRPITIGMSVSSSAYARLPRTGTIEPNDDDYVDDAGEYDWLEDHGIEGPSAFNGESYPSSSLTSMVTGSLSWFIRSSPSTSQTTGTSALQQAPGPVVPQATVVQTVHAGEDEWEPTSKSVMLDKGLHQDELDFAEIVYGA